MTIRMRVLAIGAIFLIIVMLGGCWDSEPDTDRASALVLTVSQASPKEWHWTFYFPNPTVTVSSLSQLKPSNQFYTMGVTASSLDRAYTRVQQKLARDLYLGQLEVIILSSKLTKPEMLRLLNAYNREGVTPKTVYILVGTPPVNDLALVTPQESIPSVYWESYFECHQCQPEYLGHPEWKVWDDMVTPGVSPVVPYGTKAYEMTKIAVYPGKGRPIIYSTQATEGWAYLKGQVAKETLAFETPWGRITLANVHGTAHNQVRPGNGTIDVSTDIHLSVTLAEWGSSVELTPSILKQIEILGERAVLSRCLLSIGEANRTHTDPFGYGRSLWFQHQAPEKLARGGWEPISSQVTVTLQIRSAGSGV